jgi:hypothetical protein
MTLTRVSFTLLQHHLQPHDPVHAFSRSRPARRFIFRPIFIHLHASLVPHIPSLPECHIYPDVRGDEM